MKEKCNKNEFKFYVLPFHTITEVNTPIKIYIYFTMSKEEHLKI